MLREPPRVDEHASIANGNGFNLGDCIVTDGGEDTRPTVGQFNYADIRESGGYLADKTMFIDRVLSDRPKVLLFTRPRRFGKSINLTMLDAFLNVEHRGNTWFEGTAIDNIRKYDGIRNTFPVVYINLLSIGRMAGVDIGQTFSRIIRDAYHRHDYLADSEALKGHQRRRVDRILDGDMRECLDPSNLRRLTEFLNRHHGVRPFILVDEYDAPLQGFLDTDDYGIALNTMRSYYSSLLKDNPHYEKAVLMGIMRVGHGSMLSALNNVWANTMTDPGRYTDCFGMTGDEVARVCEEAGMPDRLDEVRGYYDGYRCGGIDVYNPYSVMGFAHTGKTGSYWVDTGAVSIISDLLSRGDTQDRDDILRLRAGETVTRNVDDKMAYPPSGRTCDMGPDAVFGFLLQTGYLTCTGEGDRTKDIRIPNDEIKIEFDRNIDAWLGRRRGCVSRFVHHVLAGSPEDVREEVLRLTGDLDDNGRVHESVYHYFLAGALTGQETHDVVPEFHSGFGVADVGMIPRNEGDAAVVEFKVIGEGDDPDAVAEEAIGQARTRRYARWVRGRDTLIYGIAVGKGVAAVRFERRSDPKGM